MNEVKRARLVSRLPVFALASLLLVAASARAAGAPEPTVANLLARYDAAVNEAGAAPIQREIAVGTLAGAGLAGTFHSWRDGARQLDDIALGPRRERTLRDGDRIFIENATGNVRELRGILRRRSLTERFIDSGEFASAPERCRLVRSPATIDGRQAYALEVTAAGGEPQTLVLDAASGLPLRIEYDDDDGRTTLSLSDWRSVGGHRFPFRVASSNGDHAYDIVAITTELSVKAPIDPLTFRPLRNRTIELAAPAEIPLEYAGGHFFVRVAIAGQSFRFLIDSGAQNILLDSRVAHQLDLREAGALEVSGARRAGGLRVARLGALAIGPAVLRDLVVSTIDLAASTGGALRIDGILGYPFFASALVTLDYPKKMMRIGVPGSFTPVGSRIDLELDRALPEIQARLNGRLAVPFIVDTGNAAAILLYRPFVDRNPGIVPFTVSARRSFGIGGATASYRTKLDLLEIGPFTLNDTEADVMLATSGAFADRFVAGNIGLEVLKRFVVTFDESQAAVYFAQVHDSATSR